MIFKTKLPGCLIAAVILTGCTVTQDAKLVESYASKLDLLLGKGAEEVIPLVTDQWEFKLQARWESTDPLPETALNKNHDRAPFSKKEAKEIFMEKGHYNVFVFAKKGSEGEATEAPLNDYQLEGGGSHNVVHKYTHYVFVRFVFRDKQLHNFRCFRVQIGS